MTTPITMPDNLAPLPGPVFAGILPLLYEAEEEDLGSTDPHNLTNAILRMVLANYLSNQPQFRVFADLNFYFGSGNPRPSAIPDVMVVIPGRDLGVNVSSYNLGADGPAPVLVVEILSERTAQQRDLGSKIPIYAQLGIAEYILVDQWEQWMPQRLLLKRLQANGTYLDALDNDGGVSSNLGFRLRFEDDGGFGLFDRTTGHRYARPTEAEQEAEGRRQEAEGRRQEAEGRRQEAEARLRAEEKQRLAEEKQRLETEARLRAEEKQRLETEARLRAEEKQRLETEARLRAEEKQRLETEARLRAEEKQRLETEARLRAEEKQRLETEARLRAEEKQRLAEEKIQALQLEVERLRQAAEKEPPANA